MSQYGASTAATYGSGFVRGVSQIAQGYVQQAEYKYNATLLEGQANQVEYQKEIENRQYNRYKRQMLGKSITAVAGQGVMLSGSPVASIVDTQAQINIDQAIGQYNLQMGKNLKLSEAKMLRNKGRAAVFSGYLNAASTWVNTALQAKGDSTINTKADTSLKGQVSSYNRISGRTSSAYSYNTSNTWMALRAGRA